MNNIELKTGRALALGATNDLAIPIHHTLGTELLLNPNFDNGTDDWNTNGTSQLYVSAGGDGNSIRVTRNNGAFENQCYQDVTTEIGKQYQIKTIVTLITVGEAKIDIGGILSDALEVGEHTLYYTATSTTTRISLNGAASTSADIYWDNTSFKEILVENSFLTYHDIANDEIIQIGNAVDGGSSDNLNIVKNGTFDTDLTDWNNTSGNWSIISGRAFVNTLEASRLEQYFTSDRPSQITMDIEIIEARVGIAVYDKDSVLTYHYPISDGVTNGLYTIDCPNGISRFFIDRQGTDGIHMYVDNVTCKEILPTSTEYILNDVTVNNILTHQMPFSAGDLTLIQQEPNLLAALAMGEATPISSVTLDADDSWYACSEVSGAYVVDQRSYGDEEVASPNFELDSDWGTPANGWSIVNGKLVGNPATGSLTNSKKDSVAGEQYLISITYDEVNTSGAIRYRYGSSEYFSIPETVGTHIVLVPALVDNTGLIIFRQVDMYITISNISVKKATPIEIALYTSANRITNQQKGLQTTALLLDGAGVPESYTEEYLVKNTDQLLTLPLDTPLDYAPTKDIKTIYGTTTSLTIVHTDDSEVVVP